MNKRILVSLLVLVTIAMSVSSVSAGLFDSISGSNDLEVSNITIVDNGYSTYEINCNVTPKKDYNYLEMNAIFYDKDNAVVDKTPIAWNTNNPAKDQLIKVSGTAYIQNQNDKPVRAEVFFTDSPFNGNLDDAIYIQNVTI